MNGTLGDNTVWNGTAFSDCDKNEIVLIHNRFRDARGAVGQCNNGAILGQSMRVENNSFSSNESLYVSQLVVVVQSEMIGANFVLSVFMMISMNQQKWAISVGYQCAMHHLMILEQVMPL